jgi:hypothetical protein
MKKALTVGLRLFRISYLCLSFQKNHLYLSNVAFPRLSIWLSIRQLLLGTVQ